MNILFIARNLSKSMGGISNTSYYLARELCKTDKVILLGKNREKEPIPLLEERIADRFKGMGFVNYLLQYRKIVIENKIDYVLCATWVEAIIPYIFRNKWTQKYGIMIHGNEILKKTQGISWTEKIYYFLREKVMSEADMIFSNSEFTKNVFKSHWNKQVVVIHPCIDTNETKYITEIGNNRVKNYTLFTVSRLSERKGIQFVLKAVEKLKKKYPTIQYRVAGDGEYRENLISEVKRLKIENNVVFLGKVSQEEKFIEILNSDLFIMPSFSIPEKREVEGFGVVFLEANILGKAVIGTDSGGIADAVLDGKTGWLVPEKDPEAIYQTIDEFYEGKKTYDKMDCLEWAQNHDAAIISKRYREEINKRVKNYEKNCNMYHKL